MIRAVVIGASGYAGIQLVHILLAHPDIELVAAASDSLAGEPVAAAYPAFTGTTDLAFSTVEEAKHVEANVAFLALPHTASMGIAAELVEAGVSVIDLSADFRLKDAATYEQWYGAPHTERSLLAEAAFGLPELFPADLERVHKMQKTGRAVLVGCAGCYPTATSLAAAPFVRAGLLQEGARVVADAISGVTGAGKTPSHRTHFCSDNENVAAYGVATHRHTPEIEQILQLNGQLIFTPHLAPLQRGLLSTVTMPVGEGAQLTSTEDIHGLYRQFYDDCTFVQVLSPQAQPQTASVAGTNRAQVSVVHDKRTRSVVATCAIDNLGKGAAGQAVQCANIVYGFDEDAGLDAAALPV